MNRRGIIRAPKRYRAVKAGGGLESPVATGFAATNELPRSKLRGIEKPS